MEERHTQVARVLVRVLFLNLAVAAAKITFGYASGAISILSDGFHSLTDAATNIVGLVGIRAAGQPPDEDHPYGHRKYETVAAAAIAAFLLLLILEVLRNAYVRLTTTTSFSGGLTTVAMKKLSLSACCILTSKSQWEQRNFDCEY